MWMFEVRTLFWQPRIERWLGEPDRWDLQVPLIEQAKDAVWAVVFHLAKHVPTS